MAAFAADTVVGEGDAGLADIVAVAKNMNKRKRKGKKVYHNCHKRNGTRKRIFYQST